jgi:hypothetical protein
VCIYVCVCPHYRPFVRFSHPRLTPPPPLRAPNVNLQAPSTAPTVQATQRPTPSPTTDALATMGVPNAITAASTGPAAAMAASVMDVEMAFTYAGDPDKVAAFQRALQAMLLPYGTCLT